MSDEIKGLVNKTSGTGFGDARDVFVQIAEARITNNLDATNNHLINVANPRTGQSKDATNKGYVDNLFDTINDNLISIENNLQDEINGLLSSTSNQYDILDHKADLDVNDQVMLNQIPPEAREIRYASNISERDSISEKFVGLIVLVDDASLDPNVSSGSAIYFCTNASTSEWRLISSLNTPKNLQVQIDQLSSSTAEEFDNFKFNDLIDVQQYSSSTGVDIQLIKVNSTGTGLDYINSFDLSTYTVTPTKLIEQQFIATDSQVYFQLNYKPSSNESLEMFVNQERQMYGISKDYIVDMDTGIVTFLNRYDSLQNGDEILFRYLRGNEASHTELNGIIKTKQESLQGTVDGGNKIFNSIDIPVTASSMVIFKNSIFQKQGEDYTINNNIITFTDAPEVGSKLNCIYRIFDVSSEAVQETVIGVPNGIKLDFQLSEFPIDQGCVQVYLNGTYQVPGVGNDYRLIGKTIIFSNPPATDAKIHAVYEKNTSELIVGTVSGDQIINAGDINDAINDIINEREYEENPDYYIQMEVVDANNDIIIPIQFSTKKRIIPSINLTEISSNNVSSIDVRSISVRGFSLVISPLNNGVFQWNGSWVANCP